TPDTARIMSLATDAFWDVMPPLAPGTSMATHIDPFVTIFMPCITAAASGGICGPVIALMSIVVAKVYSSYLMPSITCDLPVGLIDASMAPAGTAVVVLVVAAAAGVEIVAVF